MMFRTLYMSLMGRVGDWWLGGWELTFNYSLLMIIILFGCLRREVPLVGTTANTTIGFVFFAKIITTPSELSVTISLPRQPLPCSNQGVQCLPHSLAAGTRTDPACSWAAECTWFIAPGPVSKLRTADGEQLALVVVSAEKRAGWAS